MFRKYNVPYFANIDCSSVPNSGRIITCPQADAVVRTVLRDWEEVARLRVERILLT